MNKIIVLTGKSASGKDTIMKRLIANLNFLPCVSHTTRPPRQGETEGVEYYFINNIAFENMILNGEFIETRKYNTVHGVWWYGMSKQELDKQLERGNVIMILDIKGLKELLATEYKDRIISFYIDVDLKTRVQRSLDREDVTLPILEECVRRVKADEQDFVEAHEVCEYTVPEPTNSLCAELMIIKILDLKGVLCHK